MKLVSKIVWLLLLVGWNVESRAEERTLTVSGSSTVHPIIRKVIPHFEEATGLSVRSRGGGSGRGVTDVIHGKSDIGMASRGLTEQELLPDVYGQWLHVHTIGHDGNAVIVHKSNPIEEIGPDEIHQIFTGKILKWGALNGVDRPVVTIVKEQGRSTRKQFEQYFNLEDKKIKADYTIGSNTEALVFVGADPDAIGFVSIGAASYAISLGTAIKMLSINGKVPTLENVLNGSYRFGSRALNLLTLGIPDHEERRLIDFVKGPVGQRIIAEMGYAPAQHP